MSNGFNTLIAELKTQANIVDIVSNRGITVNSSGARHKALCPFHNENTPSFVLDEHSQTYHCFGCGESGDVISFVQKFDNTDFVDALRTVGEIASISDIDNKIAQVFAGDDTSNVDYKVLRECLAQAAQFYADKFQDLKPQHPAKLMVTDRGLPVNSQDMVGGEFYLGYAGKNATELSTYLTNKGFSEDDLISTGLARKSEVKGKQVLFDVFSNRLLFAFTDTSGRVIGFSGRKLDDEDFGGKYINTSDTLLFNKSTAIFNFSSAKREIGLNKKVYVAEGQFDVFALREAGIKNVVAVSGTAVTDGHIKILNRAIGNSGQLVFCLDGDKAGLAAAVKTIQNHTSVQNKGLTITFPRGSDPCDVYQQENGKEELLSWLKEQGKTSVKFLVDVCLKGLHIGESEGKQKALSRLTQLCSPIENNSFVRLCANELSRHIIIPTDDIMERLNSERKEVKKSRYHANNENNEGNSVGNNISIVPTMLRERFGEIDFVDVEQRYDKLKQHRLGAIELRIFAIVSRFPGLREIVDGAEEPFSFKVTKGMYAISKKVGVKGAMVPENYGKAAPLVACVFFDSTLLPSLHSMDILAVQEHLEYLIDTASNIKQREMKKASRQEALEFLMKNSHKSISELVREIEKLPKDDELAEVLAPR